MATIRQDAWSTDEDLILAEVVLRHIREGSTQLSAFEEVGERLSRTSAACGFRWNSTIRKKYESAIALAKKQRTKGKKERHLMESEWNDESSDELMGEMTIAALADEQDDNLINEVITNEAEKSSLTMEQVIAFLTEYHQNRQSQLSSREVEELRNENEQLKRELEKEINEKRVMAEDYRALLSIMERARKMSLNSQAHES
ncbi:RsfA family transcriptional regulator [Halalkalibacter nanhaiisediminis]|uniref:Prespore-specific regulator n=1 Tax=Halalkalibacter nanhaiisediminis TaxID=688079 RepID=A0A562QGC8_9BACI|nr:RsfA family transcriptional regulator [Halalkalibacter nanhaiisediminis]TWI55789.1 prespore-specific regulator [Halalkalibacter nanhaiisediminis]